MPEWHGHPKAVHSRFNRVTLGSVAYTAGFLDLFAVSLVVPWIVKEAKNLGLSAFSLGLLGSVYGAVQFFSSPVAGYMSDKHGRKTVLLACLFLTSISYMIASFADRTAETMPFWLLLSALFISRIVAGFFKHSQVLVRAVLSESVPRSEKAAIFGRFNAFSNFGFIIGSAIGGHVAAGPRGFYHVSLCASFVFFLNFLLNWVFLETDETEGIRAEKVPEKKEAEPSPIKLIDYYDLLLVYFFGSLAALTYRSNFALILEDTFHLEPHLIGYIMSFQGIISAGTGFLAGPVAKIMGSAVRRLTWSYFFSSLSLVGVTYAPTAALAVGFLLPFSAANAIARVASAEVTAARAPPGLLGSLVGLTQTFTSSARTAAPLIASISQEYSIYGPGTCAVVLNLIGWLFTFHLAPLPDQYEGESVVAEKKKRD